MTQQPTDLTRLTLADAMVMLRRKTVSPVELVRAFISRIERFNPQLNAFITVTAEQALQQAREAEAEIQRGRWRGPLHGMPLALKDLIDTAGIRTTAASAVFKNRIPTEDAEVVRRLKAAGAVLLGKLNCTSSRMAAPPCPAISARFTIRGISPASPAGLRADRPQRWPQACASAHWARTPPPRCATRPPIAVLWD